MDITPTTICGSDLAADTAALQWYEAVAFVLQLAEAIKRVGVACAPDLPHVQLSTDGTVAILPRAQWADQPVRRLAVTLKLLLQHAEVPPELGQVIAQAAEGPSSDQDIDRFVASLHHFERPARQMVLRAVVDRIAAPGDEARIAQEVERLVAKAREAPPAPPTRSALSLARRPRKAAIAVLLVLVIVLGGAAVLWWVRPLSTRGASAVSSVVAQAGQRIAQAFNSSVGQLFGNPAAAQTPTVSDSVPSRPQPASHVEIRTRKTRDVAGAHALIAGRQAAPAPLPGLIPVSAVSASPPTVLLTAPDLLSTPEPYPEPDPEPGRIYSRLDPGVTPPVPLQPFIGRATADATPIAGDMDVLVGRTGDIERVILLVPNRYQDRMLIFAMKNRKFEPAIAHGHPVRYLLHMRTAF